MCMRIYCYRSFDWSNYDHMGFVVQRLGGWFSIGPIWIELYVPENRSEFLVLSCTDLERWVSKDWYA